MRQHFNTNPLYKPSPTEGHVRGLEISEKITAILKDDMTISHSVDDFKDSVKKDAEDMVLKKFPQKMREVQHLLKDDRFGLQSIDANTELNITSLENIEPLDSEPPKKKSKLCNETVEEENRVDDYNENPIILGVINRNKYLEEKISIVRPLMLVNMYVCVLAICL